MPPEEAWETLRRHLTPSARVERIRTAEALDRVLASDLASPEHLPSFIRSTMDGYAVRAEDTFGASDSLPAYLTLRGEIAMGQMPDTSLKPGEIIGIATGGMLPGDSNAVVMIENTQRVDDVTVEVLKPVAPGENTIAVGEDLRIGDPLLLRGALLRPQDLGALHAVGITEIDVVERLHVGILGSGNEIVAPNRSPAGAQVRDVNSVTLASLVRRAGHTPVDFGVVEDELETIITTAKRAHAECDVVIISAGSSVSVRDVTADAIAELGPPGVLVHGVALKPGKPTILAICDGKPVFGLPGNPVSCMVTFDLFVAPTLAEICGITRPTRRTVRARLERSLSSKAGRVDYIATRLTYDADGVSCQPVLSKSNLIHSLVRADGMIRIPSSRNGFAEGDMVEVVLF